MGLNNAGRDFVAGAAVGVVSALFNQAIARIGVGNGEEAFSPPQTKLRITSKFR